MCIRDRAGAAAKKKDGQTVSGDTGAWFKHDDGSLYVLLCDGMGSGSLAEQESALAVRLLEMCIRDRVIFWVKHWQTLLLSRVRKLLSCSVVWQNRVITL